MIKVVAKAVVMEDKIEEYKLRVAELASQTRKENGCISYELFQDVNNNKVLTFIEEWENQDALDKHMKSKHFQEIVPQIGQYQEQPSEVNIYRLVI